MFSGFTPPLPLPLKGRGVAHPLRKTQGTVAAGGLYSSSITPEYDCTVTRSVMVPLVDT